MSLPPRRNLELPHQTRAQLASSSIREELGLAPSSEHSATSGGTAHILPAERAKATFDVEKLTNWWDGGSSEDTSRRRWIQTELPEFTARPYVRDDVPRSEQIEEHMNFFVELHARYARKGFKPRRGDITHMQASRAMSGATHLNISQALNTVKSQASAAQAKEWGDKILRFEAVAVYSQTELGHGSNVRGILTRADYDPATQEFVLNTPVLSSVKWWK